MAIRRSKKVTVEDLYQRVAQWYSRSQPDGTLSQIVEEAKESGNVDALLDALPVPSPLTTVGARIAKIRERLERA